MTRRECEAMAELLAAFADGGLEGGERERVDRHVAGCEACRAEVAALRETLAAAKREVAAAAPARDEAFWRDFERDTRLAYDKASAARPGLWARLRPMWWGVPIAVGAAAILVVILFGIGGRDGGERADGVRGADGGVAVGVGLIEELGPEGVEDLTEEQLDRVLTAFEEEEEREVDTADTAETAEPYEAIEELDDDEIERVLQALTKGV